MRNKILFGLVGVVCLGMVVYSFGIAKPSTTEQAPSVVGERLAADNQTVTQAEQVEADMVEAGVVDPTASLGEPEAAMMGEVAAPPVTPESLGVFETEAQSLPSEPIALPEEKTALLANGCFWCAESDLEKLAGVSSVVSGYAGGTSENPTYKNHAAAGHREVVLVMYDPSVVTYAQLVEFTIKHGDPTDDEGSFNDRGPQYVPAIYYADEFEKTEARRVINYIDSLGVFSEPLPLQVLPKVTFWPAEEYHQDYAKKNPLKYSYYRTASGRSSFIADTWGESAKQFVVPAAPKTSATVVDSAPVLAETGGWQSYVKPEEAILRQLLTPLQYKVTQEDGTEKPFDNIYDKHYEVGVYVDILSGEPLFLSSDKYNSGTGWPSFTKPISNDVVTLHEDNTLFTKRTEVRSRYADSHLGHVFSDGPKDKGGLRYCMNSAALRFVPRETMEQEGYGYLVAALGN